MRQAPTESIKNADWVSVLLGHDPDPPSGQETLSGFSWPAYSVLTDPLMRQPGASA